MKHHALKYGCQTFTWEMLGSGWTGTADDLVHAISNAGYQGIEITDTMIGDYANRPRDFVSTLGNAGLELVSFAYGSDSGFTEAASVSNDLDTCRRWVDFAAHFPGAMVSLGSATIMSEGLRADKFNTAAEIYNKSAEIGMAAGVKVGLHPSSHSNTLLYSRDDYDEMFARLDAPVLWVPDTGHILRANQEIIDVMETYIDRICYVHLKDVDRQGDWAMLGRGVCDSASVVALVRRAPHFNGWIVVEEESTTAGSNPADAVKENYATLMAM